MNIFDDSVSILDEFNMSVTNCDLSDMITEISRFLYHIFLIHVITYCIDGKDELFGSQLFKTLFITALAVMAYHIIFKKFMNAKLKNIQSVCIADREKDGIREDKKKSKITK